MNDNGDKMPTQIFMLNKKILHAAVVKNGNGIAKKKVKIGHQIVGAEARVNTLFGSFFVRRNSILIFFKRNSRHFPLKLSKVIPFCEFSEL